MLGGLAFTSSGRQIDGAMVKPLEIPVRARQGIVEKLSWFADVHTDRSGSLPIHEADGHRHQIGFPAREETSGPLRVVLDEPDMGHVPVVVEGQIAVGDEDVISRELAPGTDPDRGEADGGRALEKRVGEDVAGPARKEDPVREAPASNRVFLQTLRLRRRPRHGVEPDGLCRRRAADPQHQRLWPLEP